MTQHNTDIVIIGAGPVGLFAIFEAGMMKMKCHVVDTLEMIGGQCSALYPEKPIFDIPGHPSITGQELVDKLAEQAEPFEPIFHLGQQVTALQKTDTGYIVKTSKDTEIACKAVFIAAGCGAFGPNRPPLEGLEAYEGTSVHYMVAKREAFRGKKIVIAGGGDSALDWAISLSELADHIYFVHRRPKFRAAPESVTRLEALAKEGKVEMVIPYQLAGLHGDNGQLTGVEVSTLQGESRVLEADTLLPFFGLSMELGPIAQWGLNLDNNLITVTPSDCQTSEPGIYAMGDIATYPGKLKLILSGFSEAAMACHSAYNLVHPDQAYHFEYSTTKGVPE